MDKNYDYKWTKGFGIALLIFFILVVGSAFAQTSPNTPSGYSIDSTTGNLIQNPTMTSGTGWTTSGMTGSYTPDGYIFSYASGTIQQDVNFGAINFGYQNTGAVFATGIMYGFKYRFQCAQTVGTTCDTGTTQDTLNATFTYRAPNGTVEATNVYQLGLKNVNDGNPAYNPVWQQLAETYTFAGAKPIATVGTARLSITGMDGGFWACNPDCYGPQIKDAYMRLNYSVDPCVLNPAFNSNCPGFQNILQGSKSPTFYYSYNIAQSLPHIGGGVVLHGYDYGFNWYNYGACYNTFMFWCTDWRTDGGGNINFRISDKNNTTMLQQQWYVAGNNSGGSYSNRYLFTENRNSLDMGNIQWWASDVWNHFGWVGWTRPIWTPDPCYSNGLYSPNCSNFQTTLRQTIADIKAQQDKIALLNTSSTTLTPTETITTTLNNVNSTNPSVVVTSIQTESSIQNTANNNFALSLIRQNQNRENSIAIQASQKAIKSANDAAAVSINQAESIALTQAVTSNENNDLVTSSSVNTTSKQTDNLTPLETRIGGTNTVNVSMDNRNITNNIVNLTGLEITTNENQVNTQSQIIALMQPSKNTEQSINSISLYQPPAQLVSDIKTESQQQEIKISNNFTVTLIPPQTQPIEVQQSNQLTTIAPVSNIELPTAQSNFTTDKTNPINDIIENKTTTIEQDRRDTNTQQVKSNVQDNDAAAGVSIASIARTPAGFNTYLIALNDAAFYAPKEIYRNQKTIDNVRALRQLASDKLHQEMVDQQYLPR